MALIKCPECGKEVSDAANACIHCGFPFKKNNFDQKSSLKKVILQSNPQNKLEAIKIVREVNNLSLADAKALVESDCPVVVNNVDLDIATEIVNKFIVAGVSAYVIDANDDLPAIESKTYQNSTLSDAGSKITCPKCGSDNIHFVTIQASQNFDKGDACCGFLLCGPLGLLCGVKDKTESKTVRKCMNCTNEF